MSNYLVIIVKNNDNIVYVTDVPSELKYNDVEEIIEEIKNPKLKYEILCDKALYEVIQYYEDKRGKNK